MKSSKDLFICLLGCLITLTGCDDLSRFSYENYNCQPRLTSLYEIRVSQPKPGAFANILYAKDQSKAEITSLTKTEIIIESKACVLLSIGKQVLLKFLRTIFMKVLAALLINSKCS